MLFDSLSGCIILARGILSKCGSRSFLFYLFIFSSWNRAVFWKRTKTFFAKHNLSTCASPIQLPPVLSRELSNYKTAASLNYDSRTLDYPIEESQSKDCTKLALYCIISHFHYVTQRTYRVLYSFFLQSLSLEWDIKNIMPCEVCERVIHWTSSYFISQFTRHSSMFLKAAAAVKERKRSWPFLSQAKLLHDRHPCSSWCQRCQY